MPETLERSLSASTSSQLQLFEEPAWPDAPLYWGLRFRCALPNCWRLATSCGQQHVVDYSGKVCACHRARD